jgi:hypothetical protein
MTPTQTTLLRYTFIIFITSASQESKSSQPPETDPPTIGITLPHGTAPQPEAIPHFPDRLHAYVWRNWNLVELEKQAATIKTTPANIRAIARSMGLPPYTPPTWSTQQIYITLIRRNWHLLPYEQILQLTGMTPSQLNHHLREDDFLWIKLGMLKPACEPLQYHPPSPDTQKKAQKIRQELKKHIPSTPEIPRFTFINELNTLPPKTSPKPSAPNNPSPPLRLLYPYYTHFGDPLSDDSAHLFSDGLLAKLSHSGINGIWLHALLRDLAPGGIHFPEFGAGSEKRLKNLKKAVDHAKTHGIDLYLYLNEPRAMHHTFFENSAIPGRIHTKGVQEGDYHALCTSDPPVREWLKDALSHLFTQVPGLGGVLTITGSENLTYCNSHGAWQQCPRCKEKSASEITADLNALMAEGVHRAAPHAKVIVWDWGWNAHAPATDIIEKLPHNIWLMSVSEWALPITRNNITSTVGEYSISAVGPGPHARLHWEAAQKKGLKTAAKLQLNCTWEIAAVPYVPVMDLIAEHCSNLTTCHIDGYLLSWTLGGYPSPNLQIPQKFDRPTQPSKEDVLQELALERYGEKGAKYARAAWTRMSDAYREYPYAGSTVYFAPLQMGAANLFRPTPTGYKATMVGLPYDDLNTWRAIYPPEIFAGQFEKMAAGFAEGIRLLEKALSYVKKDGRSSIAAELRYAKVVQIHFASVANQVRYILLRDEYNLPDLSKARRSELSAAIRPLVEAEMALTKALYALTLEDSCIGFESTNHYFYVPNDLLEKLINCRYVLDGLVKNN